MRLCFKLIFILLLAVRFTPVAGQMLHGKVVSGLEQDGKDKVQKKGLRQHACLTEETTEVQAAFHLRWSDIAFCFFNGTRVMAGAAVQVPECQYASADHLRLAFYRSLLYPSHFFR